MIYVNINSAGADHDLMEISRELGITLADMVVEQSRLTAQGLIQRTPPLRNMRISQAAGKGAIQGDVHKIFDTAQRQRSMGNIVVVNKNGQMIIRSPRNKRRARVISADRVGVNWSNWQMYNHHQKQRSERHGRVMGGTAADLAMLNSRADMNRYLKSVYARMGQLASGWLPALRHFASRSKVSKTMRVPPFVYRAPRSTNSYFEDHAYGDEPYSVIVNEWRYGSTEKVQRIYRAVLLERQADAFRWMATRLRKLMRNR